MSRTKYTPEFCSQFVGQTFNDLTILDFYKKQISETEFTTFAICRCKCGKICEYPFSVVLYSGAKSCGCRKIETSRENAYKAHKITKEKHYNYNQWEFLDPQTVKVYINNGYFITDYCSWKWLRKFYWRYKVNTARPGHKCYISTSIWTGKKTVSFRYHNLLLATPPNYVRDHINGNSYDNRYLNLRAVTYRENCINRSNQNRDLPTGVYINRGYYCVSMRVNGKTYGNMFKHLEDAIAFRKNLEEQFNQITPIEVPRLFLEDGTLNLYNFRFDWYPEKYWLIWNALGITLMPVPNKEYLKYMPTKDVIDFGYNGVYL